MGDENSPLPRYEQEPEMNANERRWHWLNAQVAPALGSLLASDGKSAQGNLDTFNQNVHSHYQKALQLLDEPKR